MYDVRILDTCVCEEGKADRISKILKQVRETLEREHFEFGLKQT